VKELIQIGEMFFMLAKKRSEVVDASRSREGPADK
jgi:hypothetical protein